MAKRKPTPAEWAKRHPNRPRGPQCWICATPAAMKAVAKFADLRSTNHVIAAYLRETMGATVKHFTVAYHRREHVS